MCFPASSQPGRPDPRGRSLRLSAFSRRMSFKYTVETGESIGIPYTGKSKLDYILVLRSVARHCLEEILGQKTKVHDIMQRLKVW